MNAIRRVSREVARRRMKAEGRTKINRIRMPNGQSLFGVFWREYLTSAHKIVPKKKSKKKS